MGNGSSEVLMTIIPFGNNDNQCGRSRYFSCFSPCLSSQNRI